MHLCIFNPEHDLCLAKGRAHYIPPRSAVDFARRDANIMQVLYPDAVCCSAYDVAEALANLVAPLTAITTWGWDAVVKHQLLKHGVRAELLPTDETIATIRELQHRSTVLPLQPDCHTAASVADVEALLRSREHWVMKAPWSGAGRGIRWVHGSLTDIDRHWIEKVTAEQRCVIVEPRRDVVADVALEYFGTDFAGYSYFKTGSGVYKENHPWTDAAIVAHFEHTGLSAMKATVEQWLQANVWPRYGGPLGVDLMVDASGAVYVAEINLRHTMGMVAHAKNNPQ